MANSFSDTKRLQAFGTILGMEILWSSTLPLAESCADSSKMVLLVRLILTEGVASFFFRATR